MLNIRPAFLIVPALPEWQAEPLEARPHRAGADGTVVAKLKLPAAPPFED